MGSCFQRGLEIGRGNASHTWYLTTWDRGYGIQARSRRGPAMRADCKPYSTPTVCYVFKNIPQTGVHETTWKVGGAI